MTSATHRRFRVLPERFAIHRLEPTAEIPPGVHEAAMYSVMRTAAALTLVAPEDVPVDSMATRRGWRALGLVGPLDFALTGILADLTRVLADAEVSVFALSTYDTDWVLVPAGALVQAITALQAEGYVEDDAPASAD